MRSENKPEEIFELTTVVENCFKQEFLDDILLLEKKCFPLEMQYERNVAIEYYKGALKNSDNINVFLKEGAETIGYVLAVFHDNGFDEIHEYDKEFKKQKDFFYIETIQVLPEKGGRGGAKKLLMAACKEAQKRGINKFSIHARKTNGLSETVKKLFEGKTITVREIESWNPANGEPYEYIEWRC
ncbi:MAG: GNAT family N-acetyltransferase [Candidatus Moranbacteria bacterium]|nr:GNAT family N-acetyltransferase [Candidatus Moranbacteria bacterium]